MRTLVRRAVLAVSVVVLTAGCDPSFGWPKAITPQGERARNLWIGSCIAALVVGVFVWALMFWAMFRYRKRGDELPRQVRYNLPIEVLYTIVPFIIIAALFYYTAKDEIYIDKTTANPQVTVQVVGFRWSWQFNYLSAAHNGQVLGSVTGRTDTDPVLVLPEGETVQFQLLSADVLHSFWVPNLLFKRMNIPGRPNVFQVTLDRTGTFSGQCAELCGVYHDRMVFSLHVVTPAQYQQFMSALSASGSASQAIPVPGTTTGSYS
ncbi:MAG: aa3-type cytochrome oxidase subunit II [Mycobacteriales bacterium]